MVAPDTKPVAGRSTFPRFIYIAGCDGTGKTTQARLLLEQFAARGIRARHVWLRFPFFFSLPLLACARLRGYSWYEHEGGRRHGYRTGKCRGDCRGYWDFRRSWLMRAVFPWALLLDAFTAALLNIYLPLQIGQIVVCERFVLDMLADLIVATQNDHLHRSLPGRWYLCLIPRDARLVVLDLDPETIRARRADLRSDRRLEARLEAFRTIARHLKIDLLSSAPPVGAVHESILHEMDLAARQV